MQPTQDALVFIVDDDASVREALAWLLRSRHLPSESFTSADAFAAFLSARPEVDWRPTQPGCVLLDVRMPGMSGLALFEQLIARDLLESLPVIFLTGHADVPTAVDAVKRGAFDFCEKPHSHHLLPRARLRCALRTWSTRQSKPKSILRPVLRAKSTA